MSVEEAAEAIREALDNWEASLKEDPDDPVMAEIMQNLHVEGRTREQWMEMFAHYLKLTEFPYAHMVRMAKGNKK